MMLNTRLRYANTDPDLDLDADIDADSDRVRVDEDATLFAVPPLAATGK